MPLTYDNDNAKENEHGIIRISENGDYLIPNLTLSEQPETPLGKHGRMRKEYLREHRPALYSSLLLAIDQAASERLEQLLPPMIKAAGVTEQLKATDQPSVLERRSIWGGINPEHTLL